MTQESSNGKLQTPDHFMTAFNGKGLGVFDDSIPAFLPTQAAGPLAFHFGYATITFLADLSNQPDLKTYSSLLSSPPGITLQSSTILRAMDIHPRGETPIHRTVSLDYGTFSSRLICWSSMAPEWQSPV